MTKKQQTILDMLAKRKNYYEICAALHISQSNLYSTLYYMRQKGYEARKQKSKFLLSPMQRTVLTYYAQGVKIPQIAKELGIKGQTILNHAAEGFRRLDLVRPGVDRIAALHTVLGPFTTPQPKPPITMDDPAFN